MIDLSNKNYRLLISIGCLLVLCISCKKQSSSLFELIPKALTNIDFNNKLTTTETLNILDYLYFYNGGGVAVGDINNDDLPDIFFTGNQVQNKLYLNKGNFQFEDITIQAKVGGSADWNTGVTMADVNGDGWLDIYVCAVSGINGLEGRNELFINQGNLTFQESAKSYQLDFKNYSTQSAFFDYDNDGDLDMYLLNQAVHTERSYGKSDIRNNRNAKTGDKLLRNENGAFVDVSSEAGIYGGLIGYGLGVCTADFDNNGFTDLYVSNDFHEDDYYYLNQGDGTFKESGKEKLGHISRFSMGSAAADINNDGYVDLITLDMMPESEAILKASVGEDNVDVHQLKVDKLGFHHQYARNMLQVNQQAQFFSETALYSGVSATDWSWSALFADFDLDENQDLFITNGIPKRPNDLDYIKYISNHEIKNQLTNSNQADQKITNQMPSGACQNYIYQGKKGLAFEDRSTIWLPQDISFSNGSAYGDLDGDGDLDLVTNNINANPLVYKNTQTTTNHFLKIKFRDSSKNTFGIGTKAIVYQRNKQQSQQLFTTKGFQSSSEPILHFGFKAGAVIDSILIIWPDQKYQILKDVKLDTTFNIKKEVLLAANYKNLVNDITKNIFAKINDNLGVNHVHKENDFIDFKRESLLPYKLSDRTRAMIVGDINNDGKDDLFFGGSKTEKAATYLQTQEGFLQKEEFVLQQDFMCEDVDVLLSDFDGKNGNDLLVVSGGGEFYKKSNPLLDRLYKNDGKGNFKKDTSFPEFFENGAIAKASDFDQDGDLDLFIGGRVVANNFGTIPNSYLLENTKSGFKIIENKELQKIGMVTDAIFSDYDLDGDEDLIIVGEWMTPTFFQNDHNNFVKVSVGTESLSGLWQTIAPFDIDSDGDLDYVLGNWGLNSKFKADKDHPLLMYCGDVDGNGKSESIIATEKNGKYYTINNFDELSGELTVLKKKFTSYQAFAGKTIDAIFNADFFEKMNRLEVHELASGYLRNNNGSFVFVPFEEALQLAPLTSMLVYDFSKSGKSELLIAGNYMGVTPFHGRFDGFAGAMVKEGGTIIPGIDLGINLAQKQVCKMDILKVKQKEFLVVMIHNEVVEFYEIIKNQ